MGINAWITDQGEIYPGNLPIQDFAATVSTRNDGEVI